MKTKRIIIALCLTFVMVCGLFALVACNGDDGGDNSQPSFAKHSVTVQSTEDCTLTVDKAQAEFAETITVTVALKNTDKYVESVLFNGQEAYKRSETTYDFLMGNDDVVVTAVLKDYQQRLTDGKGFATYSLENPTSLAKGNGEVDLTISLNGSYMTILDWSIKSTNQAVIPGSSVKNSYGELTEGGAISARVETVKYGNVVNALVISINTDEINTGKTFLLIDLKNGNVSSQKASLVVPIEVKETIVTEKWSETVVFDVSALPSDLQKGKFNVYFNDLNYVSGSDNKQYQNFLDVQIGEDGNVTCNIEYVPNHKYYVTFGVVADNGETTYYNLLNTVGTGSTQTGYDQLKNSELTMIANNHSITLHVQNEIIH